MKFSNAVLSTDKKGTTLNWWEYWIGHAWMTGWQSIGGAFRIWCDLMCSNYEGYGIFKDDDPEQECMDWFWVSVIADDVYPKEFLESLIQMADDVKTGKVKTYPLTQDMFDKLDDLVGDLIEEKDNGDV